jgi:hypothetical protein
MTTKIEIRDTRYEISESAFISVDPSTSLGTPVRAGPNGADRVLGDKERRVMEIFLEFT